MPETAELLAIIERIEQRAHSDTDLALLQAAHESGVLSVRTLTEASGERSVAIGGDASGALIVTGDHARIVQGPTLAVISAALRGVLAAKVVDERKRVLPDYLEAVRAFCSDLPYLQVYHKTIRLTQLYVEQHLDGISSERGTQQEGIEPESLPEPTGPMTIQNVLAHDSHVLIEGGPGSGKSTLLFALALHLLDARLRGEVVPVPVPVVADEFARRNGGFFDRLQGHVSDLLGVRISSSLPDDFFAQQPADGTEWLILLDGVDRIVDPEDLDALIAVITRLASAHSTTPHRFVITTRPLAAANHLAAAKFGFYRLRPFTSEQVHAFSRKWFGRGELAQAAEAERFVREVERREVTELAEVPLLLAMAARIYEASPTRKLPNSRAALYEEFIGQLNLLDEELKSQTWDAFRRAWATRPGGEDIAHRLYDASNRLAVVRHLATWQQQGHGGSRLAEAQAFAQAQGWLPAGVSDRLRRSISIPLMRTGLMVEQGEDLAFVHNTFREYLAAKAYAEKHSPDEPEVELLVERWNKQEWQEVLRFLLELWSDAGQDVTQPLGMVLRPTRRTTGLVRRLQRSVGLGRSRGNSEEGLLFVGGVLALGVRAAPDVADAVVNRLLGMARAGDVRPFSILSGLGRFARVPTELLRLVSDPTAAAYPRVMAAKTLTDLGYGEETVPVMRGLLADPAANGYVRLRTAETLKELGHGEETVPVVLGLLGDPTTYIYYRLDAAKMLKDLGHGEEAVPSLLEMLGDLTVDLADRPNAAEILTDLGHGAEAVRGLLARMNIPTVQVGERLRVAETLNELGHGEEAVPGLLGVLGDPTATVGLRPSATRMLTNLGHGAEAVRGLLHLVDNPTADAYYRSEAAWTLTDLGHGEEAVPGLLEVLGDPTAGAYSRLWAAKTLKGLGHGEAAVPVMLELLRDSNVEYFTRLEAAETLRDLGHGEEAVPDLLALLNDPIVYADYRMKAARILTDLMHGEEAVPGLKALLDIPTVDYYARLVVAKILSDAGHKEEADEAVLHAPKFMAPWA